MAEDSAGVPNVNALAARADDFRHCKLCFSQRSRPTYSLSRGAVVFACPDCGFHYINYLDDLEKLGGTPTPDQKERHFHYVDTVLQASQERFASKVALLKQHGTLLGARCLDVGAGGGLFLHLLREEGAEVRGIEPDPLNWSYAQERFQFNFDRLPVEDPCWRMHAEGFFDIVTLWDVIEHVNFPATTLSSASRLIKPGGLLCLDTPARDAFLYRTGEVLYRLSGGRLRSLLGAQYSNQAFGHKQIFSSSQMRRTLETNGFDVVKLVKVHELSFPYEVYLRRILGSASAARLARPLASLVFWLFRVRNKMIVVAKRRSR
jgi:2-polyprenyl-6-hydroxyphenyl methylase/3-demethylubiquinone-9 3-methyltransferase